MPLTDYALDMFIAPNLSKLTQNNIPDLSEHVKPWITTFLLNSIFRIRVKVLFRQYIINFLRRVDGAFQEYLNASRLLDEYLENPHRSVSKYYRAVSHFEQVISQSYQSFMLGKALVGEGKLFVKGESSSLERLNELYNTIKHIDGRIETGQIKEDIGLPVWITNVGLESQRKKISFEELAEMLRELASIADFLSKLPDSNTVNNLKTN